MLPIRLTFLPSLPEKENHDNLSILVESDNMDRISQMITTNINPIEKNIRNNVISFAFLHKREFYQINIVLVRNIQFALFTQSYNIIYGSLVHTFERWNVELTHECLNMILDETYNPIFNTNEKVILTTDPRSLCEYLRLDYDRWIKGFKTNYEVYNWLVSGDIDVREILSKERRNPHIKEFIEYLCNIPVKAYEHVNIEEFFCVEQKIDSLISQKIKDYERNKKFNSSMLEELGVKPTEIKHIKNCISQIKSFDEWIDETSKEEIENTILKIIKNDK
jgi:hypothetical protein